MKGSVPSVYASSSGGGGGVSAGSSLTMASVSFGRAGFRSGFPSSTLRLKSARFRAPLAWSSS